MRCSFMACSKIVCSRSVSMVASSRPSVEGLAFLFAYARLGECDLVRVVALGYLGQGQFRREELVGVRLSQVGECALGLGADRGRILGRSEQVPKIRHDALVRPPVDDVEE